MVTSLAKSSSSRPDSKSLTKIAFRRVTVMVSLGPESCENESAIMIVSPWEANPVLHMASLSAGQRAVHCEAYWLKMVHS